MTPQDKQEIKEYIHDALAGYMARVDSQNEITNHRLSTINDHLQRQNGRISKAEQAIAMALEERSANRMQQSQYRESVDELEKKVSDLILKETTHSINCPNAPRIRAIEDNLLSVKSVKKWIVGTISVVGVLMSIIFILFKIIIDVI